METDVCPRVNYIFAAGKGMRGYTLTLHPKVLSRPQGDMIISPDIRLEVTG